MSFYLTGTQREVAAAADRETALRIRALNRSVIAQAVRDAMSASHKTEHRRYRRDAQIWLFTDAYREDFLEVCAAAEWSPAFVRRCARAYIALHAKKPESRARMAKRFRKQKTPATQAPLFVLPPRAEKAGKRARKRRAAFAPKETQPDLFITPDITEALCAAL